MRHIILLTVLIVFDINCTPAPRFRRTDSPVKREDTATVPKSTTKKIKSEEVHQQESVVTSPNNIHETGIASFSADDLHGSLTESGEIFNMRAMTAAHRSLPFGTKVRVINVNNGKSVVVKINDRGPNKPDYIIDLTLEAAKRLGFVEEGTVVVKIQVLNFPDR